MKRIRQEDGRVESTGPNRTAVIPPPGTARVERQHAVESWHQLEERRNRRARGDRNLNA
jgi:hypothetical protein